MDVPGREMFEQALGKRLGPPVFRLVFVIAILAILGGAIVGAIHGYDYLRSRFASTTPDSQPPATSPSRSAAPAATQKYDLSDDDVRRLRDAIFSIRNSLPSHIHMDTADEPSARNIANKLSRGIGLGGVSTAGMSIGYPLTPQENGISIRILNLQKIPDGAKKLARAIKEATQMEPKFIAHPELRADEFYLFIGPNPKDN